MAEIKGTGSKQIKVICPKCGNPTAGYSTIAENFYEIRKCFNQKNVYLKRKVRQEYCGYKGYVSKGALVHGK